ncbi:hypothetical protein ACLOJK_023492 [Asimina triloba]
MADSKKMANGPGEAVIDIKQRKKKYLFRKVEEKCTEKDRLTNAALCRFFSQTQRCQNTTESEGSNSHIIEG